MMFYDKTSHSKKTNLLWCFSHLVSQKMEEIDFLMSEEQLIKIIIDEAIYFHRKIGPGMLENVYKTCLAYRLVKKGFYIETEKPVPVYFEEIKMECGYRADIVVERLVVVDTKSIEIIGSIQVAQLLTYLRFLNLRFGLILNFNEVLMKNGIRRVLHGY